MKPRLKNVTAEDVLNSLYYFHVDTPSDVFLMGDLQASETTEPIQEQPTQPIPRKPLRKGSTDQSSEIPPLQERGKKTETTLSRAPSGALRFQTIPKPLILRRPLPEVLHPNSPLPQRPSSDADNLSSRRPLGPRPYLSQPAMNRKPLPGSENNAIASSLHQAPVAGSSINNPCGHTTSSSESLNEIRNSGHAGFFSSIDKDATKESFSITLIRRDPASGAQWNIGKIHDYSMLEDQASIGQLNPSLHRQCSSVSVQLTTLGYVQFRAPLIPRNIGDGSASGDTAPERPNVQYSFDRWVRMVWSKAWERKYKQHERASSDQTDTWKSSRMRSSLEKSLGQSRSEDAESGDRILAKSAVQRSGFLSPWNGRCDFSTSSSGRSLKCKHTLSSPIGSSSPTGPSSGVAVEVSELRFNLPSSSSADNSGNRGRTGRPASSYAEQDPSNDNDNLPRPPATSYAAMYPSEDEDEDDDSGDILNLSLGREKAGGGIRGKRAKLGKLIVHDEGLKMLDLIVAANMGIWWTVWER
jgi:hypothetical protein